MPWPGSLVNLVSLKEWQLHVIYDPHANVGEDGPRSVPDSRKDD